MRSLSLRQAIACETAKLERCRCRCGGVLHGANRPGSSALSFVASKWFSQLPEDDPHYCCPRGQVGMILCEVCGIKFWARKGAKTCSAKCRQAKRRAQRVA